MIRVSNVPAGASTPFKPGSQSVAEYQHHHHRARTKRQNILKCDGQLELQQKNEPLRYNNRTTSKNRSHHAKSIIINNRTSPPLKEIQSNQTSMAKISDSSDHSDSEMNLFAGSKSYVTPSPSDLPKPPENWMNTLDVLKSMEQSTKVVTKFEDYTELNGLKDDSAILVIGTKSEKSSMLKPLKTKMKQY